MVLSLRGGQIINVSSGHACGVTADGEVVQQRADSNGAGQRWNITAVDGDVYRIEHVQSHQYLTARGAWEVGLSESGGLPAQHWIITPTENDAHTIKNRETGNVLETRVNSGSGAPVLQYHPRGGTNQQWTLSAPVSEGRLIQNQSDGSVVAWGSHISANGHGWSWGENDNGRLGIGTIPGGNINQKTPRRVKFVGREGKKTTAVAAGDHHSLAVLEDGSAWAWGHNGLNQLGIGEAGGDYWEPRRVADFQGHEDKKAVAIAAGDVHSIALLEDGSVWSWGENDNGRLGIGTISGGNVNQMTPQHVTFPGFTGKALAIAAGELHSLAVLEDGTVWAWGYNGHGRLGIGKEGGEFWEPRRLPYFQGRRLLDRAITVAAGEAHSVAVLEDGSVWAWGANDRCQLGMGEEGGNWSAPQRVDLQEHGGRTIVVSAGQYHNLVILEDGSVWAWGENANGRLGIGEEEGKIRQSTPRRVQFHGAGGNRAIAVSAGWAHSLAVLEDGSVWAWGNNDRQRLGLDLNDEGAQRWAPRRVRYFEGDGQEDRGIAVAAGWLHSLARS